MIFHKEISDDGVYKRSYIKIHQIEESSPKGSVESMMKQARDLKTLKIVKLRKCESSPYPCLSDQCNVMV